MAVLVLIVFVGGAWLWAYRTTPSASAITGELNAIPVNVTSEQLIRDGYIDLTKVGESSNVAVNEFLAEAKQQEAPVLKYINMEKESLTAHVLWYGPYDSTLGQSQGWFGRDLPQPDRANPRMGVAQR